MPRTIQTPQTFRNYEEWKSFFTPRSMAKPSVIDETDIPDLTQILREAIERERQTQ